MGEKTGGGFRVGYALRGKEGEEKSSWEMKRRDERGRLWVCKWERSLREVRK